MSQDHSHTHPRILFISLWMSKKMLHSEVQKNGRCWRGVHDSLNVVLTANWNATLKKQDIISENLYAKLCDSSLKLSFGQKDDIWYFAQICYMATQFYLSEGHNVIFIVPCGLHFAKHRFIEKWVSFGKSYPKSYGWIYSAGINHEPIFS